MPVCEACGDKIQPDESWYYWDLTDDAYHDRCEPQPVGIGEF